MEIDELYDEITIMVHEDGTIKPVDFKVSLIFFPQLHYLKKNIRLELERAT